MLKITYLAGDKNALTLKIEGRVAGQWVHELKSECRRCLAIHRKLILDLSGVSFVDAEGVKVLRAMMGGGIEAIGCSLFVTGLLKGGRY